MKPNSVNSYLFSLLKASFFSPTYVKSELAGYKSECIFKSSLSKYEFEIRMKEVEGNITFCKSSEYRNFIKEARNALLDPDDSPYLALALSLKTLIWSNDPHLKRQSLVKVYTTKELVEKLLRSEL